MGSVRRKVEGFYLFDLMCTWGRMIFPHLKVMIIGMWYV